MGKKNKVHILGAGSAGLACAAEMNSKNVSCEIIEKNNQVGGLASTYKFGKFKTDFGPHRFYSQNPYLYDFIKSFLGEHWIKVKRNTKFYVQGKYFAYPLELKDILNNLSFSKLSRIGVDYLLGKVNYFNKNVENFETYAISTFGTSLAELNVLNYTEKIWGISCKKLSVDWAKQRIPNLSMFSLIKNLLIKKESPKTLVNYFYYPLYGTGEIYEAIEQKLLSKNTLRLKTYPVKIYHKKKKITKLLLNDQKELAIKNLVSTVPITRFIKLLDPKPPVEVFKSVDKLKFRSQTNLFITISKPKITDCQWIYFPDKNIPFGRVTEMKNFSSKMSPPGKTSLFIEFFCWKNDRLWRKNRSQLLALALPYLDNLFSIKKKDIISVHILKEEYAYPVYDLNYLKNLGKVKKYLDSFQNLIYIGRAGRFKYTNQDHSLEMGIMAAKEIVEKENKNYDSIGSNKNYFEKGYLKNNDPQ